MFEPRFEIFRSYRCIFNMYVNMMGETRRFNGCQSIICFMVAPPQARVHQITHSRTVELLTLILTYYSLRPELLVIKMIKMDISTIKIHIDTFIFWTSNFKRRKYIHAAMLHFCMRIYAPCKSRDIWSSVLRIRRIKEVPKVTEERTQKLWLGALAHLRLAVTYVLSIGRWMEVLYRSTR